MLTFKLGKEVFRHLAKRIDKHVEPASMGHTNHNLFNAATARGVNNFVHAGNKRLATLK